MQIMPGHTYKMTGKKTRIEVPFVHYTDRKSVSTICILGTPQPCFDIQWKPPWRWRQSTARGNLTRAVCVPSGHWEATEKGVIQSKVSPNKFILNYIKIMHYFYFMIWYVWCIQLYISAVQCLFSKRISLLSNSDENWKFLIQEFDILRWCNYWNRNLLNIDSLTNISYKHSSKCDYFLCS